MSVVFSARRKLGPFSYSAELSADREIVVLFGHSGAGKSITLQMIAGLLQPSEGHIEIDGRVVFDSSTRVNLQPQERGVGYVVQDLALFTHMTVGENVAFGMPPGRDRAQRVAELLGLLNLEGFEKRKPRTLSGGQQQRVALARALAREARLLLLDEPFSALDDSLRSGLRKELLRLKEELGLTILFVTHDLREAHLLADRLAVFDEGKLLQFGPRDDVFRRPESRRVGELTGVTNIWRGVVRAFDEAGLAIEVAGTTLRAPQPQLAVVVGDSVDVMVRAERINLRRDHAAGSPGRNLLVAHILEEFAYGSTHSLRMQPEEGGPELDVEIASRPYEILGVDGRKTWTVEIPAEDIHVVRAE